MTAQPIPRANFVDQAYRSIKQLILRGELGAGAAVNIEALARQLKVSNSPIREALRRLENERWIETIPYRGSFVRRFDTAELKQVYEIREIMEVAALAKMLPDPPPAAVKRIEKALAQLHIAAQSADPAAHLMADIAFHRTIVDMADNPRLSEMFATLVEQEGCFALGRTPEAMQRYQAGDDEHDALFEAIRKGDLRQAIQLLHDHLSVSVMEQEEKTPTKKPQRKTSSPAQEKRDDGKNA